MVEHLVYPARRKALGVGEPKEVVAGRAARVQRPRVEKGPDPAQGVAQRRIRLPVDQGPAFVGGIEPQDYSYGGGLACPIRSDEPGHLPSATLNEILSRATAGPKRLRRPVTSMV